MYEYFRSDSELFPHNFACHAIAAQYPISLKLEQTCSLPDAVRKEKTSPARLGTTIIHYFGGSKAVMAFD